MNAIGAHARKSALIGRAGKSGGSWRTSPAADATWSPLYRGEGGSPSHPLFVAPALTRQPCPNWERCRCFHAGLILADHNDRRRHICDGCFAALCEAQRLSTPFPRVQVPVTGARAYKGTRGDA